MRLCAAGFTSLQRNPHYCETVGRSILTKRLGVRTFDETPTRANSALELRVEIDGNGFQFGCNKPNLLNCDPLGICHRREVATPLPNRPKKQPQDRTDDHKQ